MRQTAEPESFIEAPGHFSDPGAHWRGGWNRESVDCLFRLDHASRLDQLEAAFNALGRSVDMSIKRAA
jgi:hypothetical protein